MDVVALCNANKDWPKNRIPSIEKVTKARRLNQQHLEIYQQGIAGQSSVIEFPQIPLSFERIIG